MLNRLCRGRLCPESNRAMDAATVHDDQVADMVTAALGADSPT